MPGPGFNLGGFGGQLTADELSRAYASAGGRPEELFPAQQQAVPPAPPVPAAEPAPVPDMSVRTAGHGQRALNAYDAGNLDDANQRIDIAGKSGDSRGQDAQSYREQADLHGQQAATSKRYNDDAEKRVGERRDHEDRAQADADRIYEDMKAHATPPGQSTIEKVMGIVGMVGALGGKAGLAQGAQALGSMLGGNNLERWAAEQQSQGNLYKNALGMVGSDREGQSHDLDVAQKMTALRAHEIDSGLEQVKSMGLGRDAERHAADLQLQLRTQVRTGLKAMEVDKLKQAAKGQASAKDQYFWSVPLEQLRQMPSQVLGKDGQAVLAQRTKNDQGFREGEAEIAKKSADAATGAAGHRLTEGEAKQDAIVAGAKNAFQRLTSLPEGEFNRGATKETWVPDLLTGKETLSQRADLKNLAMSVLRVESGSAISEQEIQAKYEALPINSGDPDIRKQGLTDLLAAYQALDRQGRLAGMSEAHSAKRGGDPRVRSGFAGAPSAASRGIQRATGGGFALPQTAAVDEDALRAQLNAADLAGAPGLLVRR